MTDGDAERVQPRNPLVELFHAHLDVCKQCEEHPFGMCPVGGALLRAAATRVGSRPVH